MKHFLLNQVMQRSSEMPDAISNDKYYVVIAVIVVIFAGITGYLISLDKKIRDLENK
ncbi:MAG: CcmD family protein [Bacteroidia bacterium]|nr:CcmD family protein [Bacteroidia bacterium]